MLLDNVSGISEQAKIVSSIPRIIHQTWKDKNIPPEYRQFQQSWQTHLPEWTYHLWTDEENRAFLATHYDWFLPIYDKYEQPIMRVDAVRYFWMYHYGGLYVDLDFQCLKSIEPLLERKNIVIGLEPHDHLEKEFLQKYEFTQILCNAFMASVPKHPFWIEMIQQLIKNHLQTDTLAATGPFCLTEAYNRSQHQSNITLIPPKFLYPINDHKELEHFKQSQKQTLNIAADAYAIHHWAGSWWRTPATPKNLKEQIAFTIRKYMPKEWKQLMQFKKKAQALFSQKKTL